MRKLLETRADGEDDATLAAELRSELAEDRVYLLTPKGEVLDLPAGATVLDFAYHVHTMVGHRCRGAKVNGRIVPLTCQPVSGDRIEILTAREPAPSRDWLSPQLGYLNTASARLHVLGDLLGSVGAVVAALLIWRFGWLWSDPVVSIVVSLLILGGAWRLLRRSGHILLEGAPEGIDGDLVGATLLREAAGVRDIHHVHVWQLAGGRSVATLHACVDDGVAPDQAIVSIRSVLRERFSVEHATVQVEDARCADGGCREPA